MVKSLPFAMKKSSLFKLNWGILRYILKLSETPLEEIHQNQFNNQEKRNYVKAVYP